MKHVRLALSALTVLLLLGGYAASVVAYPENAADHAKLMDTGFVRLAAAVLFVVAVALAFLPDREGPEDA